MAHDAISEKDLVDNLNNKAVKSLRLVQGKDGKFQIYATLTWKENEQRLETQRKQAKKWVSLDRLVKHINQKYNNLPIIQLEIRNKNNEK